jgi:hypothetical protein
MVKLRMATAVASTLVTFTTETIAQTVPLNVPAAIICYAEADHSWRVGYLYRVKENGEAIFMAPDGKLGAAVNAKGTVLAPTDRPAGLDCYGNTLDELRSMGRVLEFQRTK